MKIFVGSISRWAMGRTLRPLVMTGLMLTAAGVGRAAFQLPETTVPPVASTRHQEDLIAQGVRLHDLGDFDGAIHMYQQSLWENPDQPGAYYELSVSYSAKGDHKSSLGAAVKGASYSSRSLAGLYMLIGTELDYLGRAEEAIGVYDAALNMAPDQYLIWFNVGVTFMGQGRFDRAIELFMRSAELNPAHASSHFQLGGACLLRRQAVPALMAYARFLVLEPASDRSKAALAGIVTVLRRSREWAEPPKEGTVKPGSPEALWKEVADKFYASTAHRRLREAPDRTDSRLFSDAFDTLFSILAETDKKIKPSGFLWDSYAVYFIELRESGFIEPFSRHILQGGANEGIARWLERHADRVRSFLQWSGQRRWDLGKYRHGSKHRRPKQA